jgi:hypothetical protein
MLRRTFVTTMLDAGVDLRDFQIAARHADPRTTMRYDRARRNLDRHPNYILAAYMASGTRPARVSRETPGISRDEGVSNYGGTLSSAVYSLFLGMAGLAIGRRSSTPAVDRDLVAEAPRTVGRADEIDLRQRGRPFPSPSA